MSRFLVTCAPGLEILLKDECEALLGPEFPIEVEESHILSFEGSWREAAKIMISSRLASKVLWSLKSFSARNVAMLYDQVRRIPWPDYFSKEQTFAVFAHGDTGDRENESDFKLSFAPLKIKDAVCDEFRKRGFDRPFVDRVEADVKIEAFFHGGRCEISLDLCGIPLHRRNYRNAKTIAPLRENRAAALVAFSGFKNEGTLIDPFCGGGTILIEAALAALQRSPGLSRPAQEYPLYRLYSEARKPFDEVREEAQSKWLKRTPAIFIGKDISSRELAGAQENAERAGLKNILRFEQGDARHLEAPGSFIVTNPPYGERLGNEIEAANLLGEFTRQCKHACAGSTLSLVLTQGELPKAVGFKPKRKLLLGNGPLDSVFLKYELYAGSSKRG